MTLFYFAVSWALVGLIWVIQLVKYPAFHFVDKQHFVEYHQHHEKSIILIVIPLMATEMVLSFWFCWKNNWEVKYLVPLLIILAIWLSSILIQIPLHRILEKGKDINAINKLVWTNWIRTLLWTAKGIWLWFFFST